MKNLVNLTPHAINFVDDSNNIVRTIQSSGTVARCAVETVQAGSFDGLPITASKFGAVVGMPDPEEGTAYIVSSLVAQALPERTDIFIPNEVVRDEEGRIVGCRSLGRVKPDEGEKRLKVTVDLFNCKCWGCLNQLSDAEYEITLPASAGEAVINAFASLNGRVAVEEIEEEVMENEQA